MQPKCWNDNDSIHCGGRGKGCGSPLSVLQNGGYRRGGGTFPNLQYSGGGKEEGVRERNRKGGRKRERVSEKVVEGDLPCRMIERGGEEAELHQMK